MNLLLVAFLLVGCPLIALALYLSSWRLLAVLAIVFAATFPIMAIIQNSGLLILVVVVAVCVLGLSCCCLYYLNKSVAQSDPAA